MTFNPAKVMAGVADGGPDDDLVALRARMRLFDSLSGAGIGAPVKEVPAIAVDLEEGPKQG